MGIKRFFYGVLVLSLLVGGWFGWQLWRRAGTSSDVAAFVPTDVEALAFAPRLDAAVHGGLAFARGLNESSRFRDLFKPEAGVDLGTTAGLRELGLDPEGALAVYRRQGLLTVLASVEAAERLEPALTAKLLNLGYVGVAPLEADARGIRVVVARSAGGAVAAAFAIHDGLLSLVVDDGTHDAAVAARAVFDGPGGFFASERGKAVQAAMPAGTLGPTCGPDTLCSTENPVWFYGDVRAVLTPARLLGAVDKLTLPAVVAGPVKTWLGTWAETVQHAGARLDVTPCGTHLEVLLETTDQTPLIPQSWLLPPGGPAFGELLPRDTVFMARVGLNVGAAADPFLKMLSMGASLGNLLGAGDVDPLAGVLAKVSPDLADRHVVKDLLDQVTGHVLVALLGIDRRSGLDVLADPADLPRWLANVHLAVGLGLTNGRAFAERWAPKLPLLAQLGFEKVERLEGPEPLVVKLERNCAPPKRPAPPKPGEKPPPAPAPKQCERYGLLITEGALLLTTGATQPGPNGQHLGLDRLRAVAAGKAPSFSSLTRESLAKDVLGRGAAPVGVYFSFDGLLKAISNRNLPGGATRYLAQFFELAFTFEPRRGDAVGHALLTR